MSILQILKTVMRYLGLIVLLGGISMLFIASYIRTQAGMGQERVTEGQEKIDRSTQLFSFTPLTEEIGSALAAPAENEVQRGQNEVVHYQGIAAQVHTGGIIAIILGFGLGLLSFLRKPKS